MKKVIALLLICILVFVVGCDEIGDINVDGYETTGLGNLMEFYNVPPYAVATTAIFEIAENWSGRENTELSMISEIEKLVIHISHDTPIYFENGTAVQETLIEGQTLADVLDGRILEIWSTMMLQSFPGQTFPHFIRVLESYDNLKDGYIIVEMISGNVFVNGESVNIIDSVPFWARGSTETEDGGHASIAVAAMVPLQPVAEALGLDVEQLFGRWGVSVGGASIGIDDTKVYITGHPPIELELPAAPLLADEGIIFVPTEFFSEILNYNVFVFRGA